MAGREEGVGVNTRFPQVILDAAAIVEALRRLGLDPAHILFAVHPGGLVTLMYQRGDQAFTAPVGRSGIPPAMLNRLWHDWAAYQRDAPEEVLTALWDEHGVDRRMTALLMALGRSGVTIPVGGGR